ncbi:hypothetical protein EG349_01430 [Chryseobacterium shandongense]|uniref:KAP NTPase domain-containing protein n=1 Tax=Chryseobacterium shandongense TaxID=1493872 RepID=A0AAD0YB01_9FLAO|nr:P-loop NTPase fold protein [Chryseobacterium shandongense]AZA85544.1 hypothetical protein EG349_01430 [Chryseobacterium shandongense]AZA97716.1 hypothetical protein EG353_20240 [Chryseobacterium shandongense]
MNITEFLEKNKKVVTIFIFLIILSLFFMNKLTGLISEIGELLQYNISFKIGFGLLFLVIIILYVSLINKRYIHKKSTNFLIYYIFLIYLFLRLHPFDKYAISFVNIFNSIKYADVLFVIAGLHSLNLFSTLKKITDNDEHTFFIDDAPYIDEAIDNERILEQLIETISNFKPKPAFSIGINAVWGYGKSSFLHRLKSQYIAKHPKSIVFWYRIWKNKGSNAIIENFFDELKNNLKPYSGEISNDIDKYVDSILSLSNTDLKKLNDFGKSFFTENETLESFYSDINDIIKTIDRQIIILLDDLDRLEKEEIMNTLKLIRTLSDFDNVIFIAGYDRQYITDTIDIKKANYLDKIFNVEINLLPFNPELISNELLRIIDINFPKSNSNEDETELYTVFKNLFEYNQNMSLDTIPSNNDLKNVISSDHKLSYENFLLTYRDVKRFVNEFKFNITFLGERTNVVIEEYILLKLTTYKYRNLQKTLFNVLEKFLDKGEINNSNGNITVDAYFSDEFYVYTNKNRDHLKKSMLIYYSEEDFNIVDAVLCRLFGKKNGEYFQKNQNSIAKIFYTDIYIKNNIAGYLISISQMHTAYFENQLFDLALTINRENKNLFSVINEIKQFIYNNKPQSKEQFFDSIKTLNHIIKNSNIYDDKRSLEISVEAFNRFYNKLKRSFNKDILDVISSRPIGYIDILIGELNMNLIRNIYSNDNKFLYSTEAYGIFEIEFLYIEKLKYLITIQSNPLIILQHYLRYPKYLVSDRRIIYSEETNNLIKSDIQNRFSKYFKNELFKSLRKNGIDKNAGEFVGYEPYFALAQIFSDPNTILELVKFPSDKSLYDKFYQKGWDNLLHFLKQIIEEEEEEEDEEENDKELIDIESELANSIKFIEKYKDKNYKALTENEYDQIWNNLPFDTKV